MIDKAQEIAVHIEFQTWMNQMYEKLLIPRFDIGHCVLDFLNKQFEGTKA